MDPMQEIFTKTAVGLATEMFKEALKTVKTVGGHLIAKDIIGTAAQRYAESAERRHNSIRIFGMSRPVPLEQIYTKVNVLTKIARHEHTTVSDLTQEINLAQRRFGRILSTKPGRLIPLSQGAPYDV